MSDEHEISDDEIASFLDEEARRRRLRWERHGWIQGTTQHDDEGALWAALHDTERRLANAELRLSWAFGLVLSLAAALGITELCLAMGSLSSH